MFSSLSSFLPNALQPNLERPPEKTEEKSVVEEHDDETMSNVNEMGVRKKERKSANETFIIVRPPPSKSNHPLNLQVQLVPPSAKERSRRDSMESTATDGQELRRTTSNRSDNGSIYSSYSSVASVASVGSTASSASGRRMIIPLYNLQAHNVMTNVIADAGTDAKISKFYKRGMEVIGLAVLEPTEVYGVGGNPTVTDPALSRSTTPEPPHTPLSSQHSLSSSGHDAPHAPEPVVAQPATGAKKIFGRFFKKKDAPNSPSVPTTPKSATFATGPTPRPSKRASLLLPPGGGPAEPTPMLMPAVLGIQPSLSAVTFPPTGRPSAYTWVVRRWLKGAHESMLGNVVSGVLGAALSTQVGPGAHAELRFEWRRGAKGGKRGRRNASATPSGKRASSRGGGDRASVAIASSNAPSTASLASQGARRSMSATRKESKRASGGSAPRGDTLSIASASEDADPDPTPRVPSDVPRTVASTGDDDDDGDESDPEDSETPWTCTLVARRALPGAPAFAIGLSDGPASPGAPDGAVRVKVATLAPTPHHPKVVAALKVPFPLPDIEVDALSIRRRIITPAGVARPIADRSESSSSSVGGTGARGAKAPEGLVLTAEEIKDIVSSTGMWLVCREGIGGVGRVARKGDGWRIRA